MTKFWFCCALFMTSFVCNAQLRKLPAEFEKWLTSKGMRHATVTMEVAQLTEKDPQVIYSYDNERSVQPASVMKLVTTAAALSLLDPKTTVSTEVYITGDMEEGRLAGDVIIKGYGNALLSSSRSLFARESFANAVTMTLKKEGIIEVTGDIVGDGTVLRHNPVSSEWTWEDMGNHYAPPISGLNYGDNMFEIVLNTSRKGQKPSLLKIEPMVDGLSIDNQLLDKDYAFDSAYVYGAPYQLNMTLLGAVPHRLPQFTVKGAVPDPAQFAASRIKASLIRSGINVKGQAISSNDGYKPEFGKARLIYTHKSEPLSFVAKQTNVYSVNLLAEMLLRQIALKYGDGTETAGIAIVLDFLRKEGIDTEGMKMFDGCGLAPADRVTARMIVELLAKMHSCQDFVGSLAVAGRTGTVYSFLKNTRLEGKARLKTGTTKAVIAYAGYAEGTDGHTYAVTIIVNNHGCVSSTVRKNIEKMMLLLIP